LDELRDILAAAGVEPPYLLVGHSFSSLTVQAFAYLHPDEVMGIVLVDGAHEDQMERFPPELASRAMLAGFAGQLRQLAQAGRRGEPLPELMPVPESFPEPLATAYRDATSPTTDRLETAAAEYEGLEESQAQVRELSGSSLGEIPIVALRHGVPQSMPGVAVEVNERYETAWQQMQDELATRSDSGQVIVAEGAGHMIHHDRPDLVVQAIRRLPG
jgi:pimeloyl-ACP methyl ester carboxylesterase